MASPTRRGAILTLALVMAWPLAAKAAPAPSKAWSPASVDRVDKLDPQLAAVDRVAHEKGDDAALAEARRRGLTVVEKKVRVVFAGAGNDRSGGRAAASQGGGRVEAEYAGLVQALMPPGSLRSSSQRGDVDHLRPPMRPVAEKFEGESSYATNATSLYARGTFGAGVKIGIIDLGFGGYTDRQTLGDLPATLHTADFCGGQFSTADVHGAAVSEVIYDLAPEAELYLICFDTEVTLGLAKDYAKTNGIQVINHSIAWYNSSRGDGTGGAGSPDAIAKDARNSGILWVNAAGNDGQSHWTGTFSDADNDGVRNFSGSDETNGVMIPAGFLGCFFLKWDRWPTTNQDFGLYLFAPGVQQPIEEDEFPIAGSDAVQNGNDEPSEGFCYQNPGSTATFGLVITRSSPTTTSNPRFDLFASNIPLQYQVAAGSIVEPASSPYVLAAGAVCWSTGGIETYSARGPTISGLTKPDLVAPDSMTTATYGAFSTCGETGFPGTSAASPNVAAAAALVKSANPGFSAAQLQSYLALRGIDAGAGGKDNTYGSGRLWMRTFSDVPTSDYGYASIEQLYASGLTSGCNGDPVNRRYCPSGLVTRAEMAPFLVKAMGLGPCTTCSTPTFTDVPKTYWAYQWIEQLVKQGVTAGCATNPRRYCPTDNVTRAEMAPFLMKAAGIGQCTTCTTQTFTDVPKTYWAFKWIEQLVKKGVTSGCSTNPKRYCPESSVTRRDMGIFLVRTFDLVPHDFTPLPNQLFDMVFTPDGATIFATNPAMNRVEVYSTATHAFSTPITVGSAPKGLDITPDGSTLYVANSGALTVSVVNVATKTVSGTLSIPCSGCSDHPFSIGIASNAKAIVTTTFSGSGFGCRVFELTIPAHVFTHRTDFPVNGVCEQWTVTEPSGDRSKVAILDGFQSKVFDYIAGTDSFTPGTTIGDLQTFVALDEDGSVVLINPGNETLDFDPTTTILNGSLVVTDTLHGAVRGVALAADGSTGYRAGRWGIDVLDMSAPARTGFLLAGDTITSAANFDRIGHIVLSPDGSLLAVITQHGFSTIRTL